MKTWKTHKGHFIGAGISADRNKDTITGEMPQSDESASLPSEDGRMPGNPIAI